MFTGIITTIGTIADISGGRATIHAPGWDCAAIAIGASIAVSGICLTATTTAAKSFTIDASPETFARTTMQEWQAGHKVNLERALAVGDELGGHIVFGHVDCVARVEAITEAGGGNNHALTIAVPDDSLSRLIAAKGSVTLDGVSLTVNEVNGRKFSVMVIPHTWENTTLAMRKPGDGLNLEADMLARYVARQMETRK